MLRHLLQSEAGRSACSSTARGSGRTVIAAVLAMELGRQAGTAVLADLRGDAATVLGVEVDGAKPGLRQWMATSPSVPLEAAARLVTNVMPELLLLPPGPLPTE